MKLLSIFKRSSASNSRQNRKGSADGTSSQTTLNTDTPTKTPDTRKSRGRSITVAAFQFFVPSSHNSPSHSKKQLISPLSLRGPRPCTNEGKQLNNIGEKSSSCETTSSFLTLNNPLPENNLVNPPTTDYNNNNNNNNKQQDSQLLISNSNPQQPSSTSTPQMMDAITPSISEVPNTSPSVQTTGSASTQSIIEQQLHQTPVMSMSYPPVSTISNMTTAILVTSEESSSSVEPSTIATCFIEEIPTTVSTPETDMNSTVLPSNNPTVEPITMTTAETTEITEIIETVESTKIENSTECKTAITKNTTLPPQEDTNQNGEISFDENNQTKETSKKNGEDEGEQLEIIEEPLHKACAEGNLETLKMILETLSSPTDVNKPLKDKTNFAPMHVAAIRNQIGACKLLLEYSADVNALSGIEATPLHLASSKGHREMVQFLLGHGADTKKRDLFGYCPLHLAIKSNHLEVADDLLLFGTDVNYKKCDGRTALLIAVERKNTKAVEFLLEKDAWVNIKDQKGNSPLLMAAKHNLIDIIKLLASKDISPPCNFSVTNTYCKNILHIAAEEGHLEVVELVSELKPQIVQKVLLNEKDKMFGWTPLFYAVQNMHAEVIGTLTRLGADINMRDDKGRSPIHLFLEIDPSKRNDHVLLKLLECPRVNLKIKFGDSKETLKDFLKKTPKYKVLLKDRRTLQKLYEKSLKEI